MKTHRNKSIELTFSLSDYFFISFLADSESVHSKELYSCPIDNGNEYDMVELSYRTNIHDISIADNSDWIFNDFYKMLKKGKFKKLNEQLDYDNDQYELIQNEILERLKLDQDDIVHELKYIKTEYKLLPSLYEK